MPRCVCPGPVMFHAMTLLLAGWAEPQPLAVTPAAAAVTWAECVRAKWWPSLRMTHWQVTLLLSGVSAASVLIYVMCSFSNSLSLLHGYKLLMYWVFRSKIFCEIDHNMLSRCVLKWKYAFTITMKIVTKPFALYASLLFIHSLIFFCPAYQTCFAHPFPLT